MSTCSTFLLPFTLDRWTESVTCTDSSLSAVGYAYSERHRETLLCSCFGYGKRISTRAKSVNSQNRHRHETGTRPDADAELA